MKKKLTLTFIISGLILAGPAAASLDSGHYINSWYTHQFSNQQSEYHNEVVNHGAKQALNFAEWWEKTELKILSELNPANLIQLNADEFQRHAESHAVRLEEVKNTLHTNELDTFVSEEKESLSFEMEDELEEFFTQTYLSGE